MTTFQFGRINTILALATLGAASWGCQRGVRPDEMSSEAHRQEAAKVSEQAKAESESPKAPPPNLALNPGGDPQGYYSPVNNQTSAAEQAARAERLSAHGRQHLSAAAKLEASEDAECQSTPVATRAACPLIGPATTLADIPGGVRVRFAPSAHVDSIVTHMRCHLAFARTRGFEDVAGCPLYVKGIEIARGPDRSVDIVSKDTKAVSEIRARAREEVVVVRAATP